MLLYYLTAIKGNVAFKFWNFFQSKQIYVLTDNDAIIYFFKIENQFQYWVCIPHK